jgi:hypothetical protein
VQLAPEFLSGCFEGGVGAQGLCIPGLRKQYGFYELRS